MGKKAQVRGEWVVERSVGRKRWERVRGVHAPRRTVYGTYVLKRAVDEARDLSGLPVGDPGGAGGAGGADPFVGQALLGELISSTGMWDHGAECFWRVRWA